MDTERIHILVVDDLPDMAESTAELLTLGGYDATACDGVATALVCARARRSRRFPIRRSGARAVLRVTDRSKVFSRSGATGFSR